MKGNKTYTNRGFGPDLGGIFDEIFEAAQNFRDEFQNEFQEKFKNRVYGNHGIFDENTDYYPNYSYPPMNVFMLEDRSLVFEFALAGFEEKDINLSFQGDYMLFSAKITGTGERAEDEQPEPGIRYFKRRLKLKDIEKQKYFVPLDKYAQDQVKAVFRSGILRVSIPPKKEPDMHEGIKIEIVSG